MATDLLDHSSEATDVLTGADLLALGEGWHPLEVYRGTRFRWVGNDAIVYVAALRPTIHTVRLLIEPGPGVGLRAFDLKVFSEDDTLLASLTVAGRQSISVDIFPTIPKVHALRLHVDGAGKPALNDPRILNFRVFEISVERQAPDVLPAWAKLGHGWYPLEVHAGSTFRWVDNDAVIDVAAAGGRRLQFDVEAGPGLESKPFALSVRESDGAEIAKFDVPGWKAVDLELPRTPIKLTLHVEGGGKPAPGDKRTLNFRVFKSPSAA